MHQFSSVQFSSVRTCSLPGTPSPLAQLLLLLLLLLLILLLPLSYMDPSLDRRIITTINHGC
jgi:hypothetical protein